MRIEELKKIACRRKLDQILICNPANIRALTGISCDNAVLSLNLQPSTFNHFFYTDFRYVPMVHRVAPSLKCRDIRRLAVGKGRIGYEGSLPHARFLAWQKLSPKARFVDISDSLSALRAVKTPDEIAALRAAELLNCRIWNEASRRFKAGMTERQMARVIKKLMVEWGDGEAFDTIVCVGKNAAECHHEPDDTVWNGREPVLVDMGVKLDGFCSDLTRNLIPGCSSLASRSRPARPARPSRLYRQVYDLVLEANLAAIAAAKPGITGRQLDKVARDVIRKGGFGKCFGHSLGHGVGYEIHEAPYASKKSDTVLKPGMLVTIEPGVYLEDNLGVRIEDLVLITETGCEVLSACAAKSRRSASCPQGR